MDPKRLLSALAEEQVDYVLVGGIAAAMHGTTRITPDVDIAYATDSANLQRLCAAINRFEPRRLVLGQPEGAVLHFEPELLRKERVVQLETTIGRLDLLDRIRGFGSYAAVKKLKEIQTIGVTQVHVLSIDGLIKAKRAMGRPKDIQDVTELEAIREVRRLTDGGGSFRVTP